jgi:hypothetical protein
MKEEPGPVGIGMCCWSSLPSVIPRGKFHRAVGEILEVPRYPKGRPKAENTRIPLRIDYRLTLRIEKDEEAMSRAQREAGCFVLLTNVPKEGPRGMDSYELLATYKAQDTIERNFGFLKLEFSKWGWSSPATG